MVPRLDEEHGQTIVIVVLMLAMLMGFMALAVDGGRFYAERRFLQNAADAAALACAQKLKSGGSISDAQTAAINLLTNYGLRADPAGVGPTVSGTPVYTTWFNSSGSADKRNLAEGVVATATNCRVALRATIQMYFIRVLNPGLATTEIPANAHAKARGGLQPIVVNRYDSPPGPSTPSSSSGFHDYTMRESTDWNCTQGSSTPGCVTAADESLSCTANCLWGRERVILGQGYSASDSDFRGFLALDVRDFTTTTQSYYNGTSGMNENTLKDQEAAYVAQGYPGPDLPTYDGTGTQGGLQVGIMSGNSTGIIVDNYRKYFRAGDYILVELFDGQVRQIPDFTLDQFSASAASPSGPANGPSFRVGANVRFRQDNDTVHLAARTDSFTDLAGASQNWTPSQLQIVYNTPADATNDRFWFDPGTGSYADFTPGGGSGTTVTVKQLQIGAGASSGIYSVIVRGNSPQTNTTHQVYVPLTIGSVTRDFSMDFTATAVSVSTSPTGNATFTFNLSTGSGNNGFGNNTNTVSFTGDRGSCTGANEIALVKGATTVCKSVTLPNATAPGNGNQAPTVTLNIPVSGLADGQWSVVFRGSGSNSDSQTIRHVQELTISVGSSSNSGKYVNVLGYALFKITSLDTNTVKARAVTGSRSDPNDATLALGKLFRLVPWDKDPY